MLKAGIVRGGVMPNARFVCAAATALPAFLFVMTQPAHAACQLIHSAEDLQAMQLNLAGNYCLAHNIDLASIPNFVPIGTTATPFTGKFSGRAHAIRNLTIDSHAASVGLFGYTEGARIENVRIINANV